MKRPSLPPRTLAVVQLPTPYGAAELKRSMGPNLLKGLAVSIGLCSFALSAVGLVASRAHADPDRTPIVIISDSWSPPRTPVRDDPRPAAPPKATANTPRVGTVKPVPNADADTLAVVVENRDLNAGPSSPEGVEGGQGIVEGGTGTGAPLPPVKVVDVQPTPAVELPKSGDETPPEALPSLNYELVEVMPTVATKTDPEYPEMLRRAGIEGRVVARVLVGRDGRAEDVVVLRSDNVGFDEATLRALRTWTFTPAIQAGQPVRVWMTIPVRFRQR